MAIINDDKIGNYYVWVIAKTRVVRGFQVPDLANAKEEATRIWHERNRKGLPTARIFAKEMLAKTRRGFQLGEVEHEL